jgi:hypothetical protein
MTAARRSSCRVPAPGRPSVPLARYRRVGPPMSFDSHTIVVGSRPHGSTRSPRARAAVVRSACSRTWRVPGAPMYGGPAVSAVEAEDLGALAAPLQPVFVARRPAASTVSPGW